MASVPIWPRVNAHQLVMEARREFIARLFRFVAGFVPRSRVLNELSHQHRHVVPWVWREILVRVSEPTCPGPGCVEPLAMKQTEEVDAQDVGRTTVRQPGVRVRDIQSFPLIQFFSRS